MPECTPSPRGPGLLDQVRAACRLKHYSLHTETAYVHWVRRYVHFHGRKDGLRHPLHLGPQDVSAFLTYLARERRVAASTQNQALNALVFPYQVVLRREFGDVGSFLRAGRRRVLPVVLTRAEVRPILSLLPARYYLKAALLYGSGLRLMECLRVKDVDLEARSIVVRSGKGGRDPVTMLPGKLLVPLREQVEHVRVLHVQDLRDGCGIVALPAALPAIRRCPAAVYHGLGAAVTGFGNGSRTGTKEEKARNRQ